MAGFVRVSGYSKTDLDNAYDDGYDQGIIDGRSTVSTRQSIRVNTEPRTDDPPYPDYESMRCSSDGLLFVVFYASSRNLDYNHYLKINGVDKGIPEPISTDPLITSYRVHKDDLVEAYVYGLDDWRLGTHVTMVCYLIY